MRTDGSLHISPSGRMVPSGSSRAKPRSIPITAPPPVRGRTAAAISPTWPTLDSAVAVEVQHVAGEHVDPPQAAPARRPDRPLPMVGHHIGELVHLDHRASWNQVSTRCPPL